MMLQIAEEGHLTDLFGCKVTSNTVVIMTSNIGADIIKGGSSFGFGRRDETPDYDGMKKSLMGQVEKFFRPEFINRLDDVIVFRPLNREDLTRSSTSNSPSGERLEMEASSSSMMLPRNS